MKTLKDTINQTKIKKITYLTLNCKKCKYFLNNRCQGEEKTIKKIKTMFEDAAKEMKREFEHQNIDAYTKEIEYKNHGIKKITLSIIEINDDRNTAKLTGIVHVDALIIQEYEDGSFGLSIPFIKVNERIKGYD